MFRVCSDDSCDVCGFCKFGEGEDNIPGDSPLNSIDIDASNLPQVRKRETQMDARMDGWTDGCVAIRLRSLIRYSAFSGLLSLLQSFTQSNEGYPNILDANGPEVFYNCTAVTVSSRAAVSLRRDGGCG